MKYYEVHDPYYALIKARDKEEARTHYVQEVAFDDGTLSKEILEVPQDFALIMYTKNARLDEEGNEVTVKALLEIVRSEQPELLLIDGSLI